MMNSETHYTLYPIPKVKKGLQQSISSNGLNSLSNTDDLKSLSNNIFWFIFQNNSTHSVVQSHDVSDVQHQSKKSTSVSFSSKSPLPISSSESKNLSHEPPAVGQSSEQSKIPQNLENKTEPAPTPENHGKKSSERSNLKPDKESSLPLDTPKITSDSLKGLKGQAVSQGQYLNDLVPGNGLADRTFKDLTQKVLKSRTFDEAKENLTKLSKLAKIDAFHYGKPSLIVTLDYVSKLLAHQERRLAAKMLLPQTSEAERRQLGNNIQKVQAGQKNIAIRRAAAAALFQEEKNLAEILKKNPLPGNSYTSNLLEYTIQQFLSSSPESAQSQVYKERLLSLAESLPASHDSVEAVILLNQYRSLEETETTLRLSSLNLQSDSSKAELLQKRLHTIKVLKESAFQKYQDSLQEVSTPNEDIPLF